MGGGSTVNLKEMFKIVDTVLLIDWPTKDVPETLTRAGFHVVVRGGPGPEDYSAYELNSGEVVTYRVGRPPERADLIYSHRPFSELPEIIATAKSLHAKTIWTQSGLSAAGVNDPKGCWVPEEELRSARNLVQSAGLTFVTEPYIGDVAREIRALA
jgi:predicted CoA-binding protein